MDSKTPEALISSTSRIILKNNSDSVVLKQLVLDDATDFFNLVNRNRDHFNQYGLDYAKDFPTLDSVEYFLANPNNPKKIVFGIWEDKCLVGTNSVLDCGDGTGLTETIIGKEFAGSRFASRGRTLLIDFAFSQLGLTKLVSHINVDNIASIKSIERSGFTLESEEAGICTYVLLNPTPTIH